MSQDYISNLYQLRFENAKERSKFGEEYLNDYEQTVVKLKTSKADTLGLTSVFSDAIYFLIFFEPATKKVLGILKTTPNDHSIELVDNTDRASGFEKYSKGTLIE
jgi:hypothetical protein